MQSIKYVFLFNYFFQPYNLKKDRTFKYLYVYHLENNISFTKTFYHQTTENIKFAVLNQLEKLLFELISIVLL